MKYPLICISVLWLAVHWCTAHSLSKIELKKPSELVHQVQEKEDGGVLAITKSEEPALAPYGNPGFKVDKQLQRRKREISLSSSKPLGWKRARRQTQFKKFSKQVLDAKKLANAILLDKNSKNSTQNLGKIITEIKPNKLVVYPGTLEAGDKVEPTNNTADGDDTYGMDLKGGSGVEWNNMIHTAFQVGNDASDETSEEPEILTDSDESNQSTTSEDGTTSGESGSAESESNESVNGLGSEEGSGSEEIDPVYSIENSSNSTEYADTSSAEISEEGQKSGESSKSGESENVSDSSIGLGDGSYYVEEESDSDDSGDYTEERGGSNESSSDGIGSGSVEDSSDSDDGLDIYFDRYGSHTHDLSQNNGDNNDKSEISNKFEQILDDLHDIFVKGNATVVFPHNTSDKEKNLNLLDMVHNIFSNIKNKKNILTPGVVVTNGGDPNKPDILNVLEGMFTNIIKNNIIINNVPIKNETTGQVISKKDPVESTSSPYFDTKSTASTESTMKTGFTFIEEVTEATSSRLSDKTENPEYSVPTEVLPERNKEPAEMTTTSSFDSNESNNSGESSTISTMRTGFTVIEEITEATSSPLSNKTENPEYSTPTEVLPEKKKEPAEITTSSSFDSNESDNSGESSTISTMRTGFTVIEEITETTPSPFSDKTEDPVYITPTEVLPEQKKEPSEITTPSSFDSKESNNSGENPNHSGRPDEIPDHSNEGLNPSHENNEHKHKPSDEQDVFYKNGNGAKSGEDHLENPKPTKAPNKIDCPVKAKKDDSKPREDGNKNLDYMLDLMNNEKFWSFMGDLGAKYLESLTERTTKFIEEEVAAQVNKYFKEHPITVPECNGNKGHKPDDCKHHNHVSPAKTGIPEEKSNSGERENPKDENIGNNDQTEKPFVNTEATESLHESTENPLNKGINENMLKRGNNKNPVNVEAQTLYGNTVGNEKVTNIFIFYATKNMNEIKDNIKNLIHANNSTNIFTFGPHNHKPSHIDKFKDTNGTNESNPPIETTTESHNNDVTDKNDSGIEITTENNINDLFTPSEKHITETTLKPTMKFTPSINEPFTSDIDNNVEITTKANSEENGLPPIDGSESEKNETPDNIIPETTTESNIHGEITIPAFDEPVTNSGNQEDSSTKPYPDNIIPETTTESNIHGEVTIPAFDEPTTNSDEDQLSNESNRHENDLNPPVDEGHGSGENNVTPEDKSVPTETTTEANTNNDVTNSDVEPVTNTESNNDIDLQTTKASSSNDVDVEATTASLVEEPVTSGEDHNDNDEKNREGDMSLITTEEPIPTKNHVSSETLMDVIETTSTSMINSGETESHEQTTTSSDADDVKTTTTSLVDEPVTSGENHNDSDETNREGDMNSTTTEEPIPTENQVSSETPRDVIETTTTSIINRDETESGELPTTTTDADVNISHEKIEVTTENQVTGSDSGDATVTEPKIEEVIVTASPDKVTGSDEGTTEAESTEVTKESINDENPTTEAATEVSMVTKIGDDHKENDSESGTTTESLDNNTLVDTTDSTTSGENNTEITTIGSETTSEVTEESVSGDGEITTTAASEIEVNSEKKSDFSENLTEANISTSIEENTSDNDSNKIEGSTESNVVSPETEAPAGDEPKYSAETNALVTEKPESTTQTGSTDITPENKSSIENKESTKSSSENKIDSSKKPSDSKETSGTSAESVSEPNVSLEKHSGELEPTTEKANFLESNSTSAENKGSAENGKEKSNGADSSENKNTEGEGSEVETSKEKSSDKKDSNESVDDEPKNSDESNTKSSEKTDSKEVTQNDEVSKSSNENVENNPKTGEDVKLNDKNETSIEATTLAYSGEEHSEKNK